MQYGYDMKNKYGNGYKRNVRFEDAEHTFVSDMLIPGQDNPNNKWVTVDYQTVLADRQRRARARERGQGQRLNSISNADEMADKEDEIRNLPSTGVPASSAGYAGSGAGMGNGSSTSSEYQDTWGSHRSK